MTVIDILYGTPDQRAGLTESPVWDDQVNCWYWIDIPKRQIHRHTLDDVHTTWQLPNDDAHDPGSLCICTDGQLLVALRSGFAFIDTSSPEGLINPDVVVGAPYDMSTIRFNDGGVDAQGRFWVGSLFAPKTHTGASLYCLERGLLHAVSGDLAENPAYQAWGVTTSNGWAMSLDGHHMYQADTQAHTVYRFAFDATQPVTQSLSNREVFFRSLTQAESKEHNVAYQGRPDGAIVDSAGNYWSAQFEGGQLVYLSAQGEVLSRLPLPAKCPTMMCLGGEDLKTLIITNAGARPDEELADFPANGWVLKVRVETAGLPTRRYQP